MSETNAAATDAAIDAIAKPADTVALPASEVIRLRELEKQHQGLERDTARGFIDRDLAMALNVDGLVPGAATQLAALWQNDFEAKRVDGRWVVSAKSGGSVSEVVKARLATADYAHFIRATTRAGGGGGGSIPAPSLGMNQTPPTLGHRMVEAAKASGAGVSPFLAKYR